MKIIVIGIQGSGKSTQGNLLAQTLAIPYLSSGQIFREMAQEKTPWGQYVKQMLSGGHLIPDEKTIKIIEEYLGKPGYKKGYILDGFPRTVVQAKSFKDDIDTVLYLYISDEEALKRLSLRIGKEAREDDRGAAIERRIDLFHRLTEPMLDYYRKKGMLEEVDGQRSIEDIHKDIIKRLGLKNGI